MLIMTILLIVTISANPTYVVHTSTYFLASSTVFKEWVIEISAESGKWF